MSTAHPTYPLAPWPVRFLRNLTFRYPLCCFWRAHASAAVQWLYTRRYIIRVALRRGLTTALLTAMLYLSP
jgi:hypothetical protein